MSCTPKPGLFQGKFKSCLQHSGSAWGQEQPPPTLLGGGDSQSAGTPPQRQNLGEMGKLEGKFMEIGAFGVLQCKVSPRFGTATDSPLQRAQAALCPLLRAGGAGTDIPGCSQICFTGQHQAAGRKGGKPFGDIVQMGGKSRVLPGCSGLQKPGSV